MFDLPSLLDEKDRKSQGSATLTTQLLIALLLNILSLALPIMMLQVYDRIIPHQSYGTLIVLLTGVLAALALDVTLRIIRSYLVGWSSAAQEHQASFNAVQRFTQSNLAEFEKVTAGSHLQNLMALGRLREFYSGQAWTALVDLPFAAIFIILIYYLGGDLVLVPLALLLAFFLTSVFAGKNLKKVLEARNESDNTKSSFVVSVISGIHTVKSLAVESFLLRRFEHLQAQVSRSSYEVADASGAASIMSAAFGQLSLILTASLGFFLVLDNSLSVGGLSACTLLAGRCIQPIQRVLGTWLRYQDLSIARREAASILDLPLMPRLHIGIHSPQGRISIDNLSYISDDGDIQLKNITLSVTPGSVVAITGGDEKTKSSLLQLIAGVLMPAEGYVQVDDVNPAQYSLSALKTLIGYLPQDGAIFKGSILDNLTGFDEENIESAKNMAEKLGIDKIVELMPRGYQTLLTDAPSDPIPPGVRQRIALARILARGPAVLLFDDAHRTLDKDGYNLLFKLMGQMKGRVTMILITKDQNLLSLADRHYLLNDGTLSPLFTDQNHNIALLSEIF